MSLSVAIITLNEERNLGRSLESVRPIANEMIVLDCGSTDRTLEVARGLGAKVFVEEWKGYAAQKNSAIAKCTGDWILSLDADEMVEPELAQEIRAAVSPAGPPADEARPVPSRPAVDGYFFSRKNLFLGRWIKHGGFWPDRKLRLFRRGKGRFEERVVHETARVEGPTATLHGALLHDAYPALAGYITQMNRYSTLAAEMATRERPRGFNLANIILRPKLTFLYNYGLRLGFLDGKEGLLLHLYHAAYVSWKYAKAWEQSRRG
jgi:glycosyltransferase involved in cell wall biosynthesis